MTFEKLPLEIQEKILEKQFEACGVKNPEVFINSLSASASEGGFNWEETVEGFHFWEEVLNYDIFMFYTIYPKIGIKNEFIPLYKEKLKINKIRPGHVINIDKIKELNLEHILKE